MRRGLAALLVVAALVPTAAATLPLATARTEIGQVAAAEAVCDALDDAGPRPALLTVGFRARVEWAPVVRARCGVPLVGLEPPAGATRDARRRARPRGRRRPGRPATTRSSWSGDLTSAQTVADQTGRHAAAGRRRCAPPSRPGCSRSGRWRTRELPVSAWLAPLP